MGDWLSEYYQRAALVRWTIGVLVAPIGGVAAVSWTPFVIFALVAFPLSYVAWIVGIPLFAWLQHKGAPGHLYSVCGALLGPGTIIALVARGYLISTNAVHNPLPQSFSLTTFGLYLGVAAIMGAATGWLFWAIAIRPAITQPPEHAES